MGSASAHSRGSVPVRSGLLLVGQLKSGLGKVQQSGADQRCRDVPMGCSGGLAGPGDKQAPTEARLRPEGRTRAKSQLREWSLCVGYQLCRPTALSSRLPNSYQNKLLMAI